MTKYFFKVIFIGFFTFMIISCSKQIPQEVIIKDAHLYVPLKGSMMTSGYLSMENTANKSFVITGISCSSSRAEIHETKVNASGIMTMEKKDTFVLNPFEKIIFVPGGKHIMLRGLIDPSEKYLDCSFNVYDEDPINFKFTVQERG
jgi:copper(I)-binding protein